MTMRLFPNLGSNTRVDTTATILAMICLSFVLSSCRSHDIESDGGPSGEGAIEVAPASLGGEEVGVGNENGLVRQAKAGDSIEEWVRFGSDTIARVRVDDLGSYLYNSPSGEVPTPPSSGEWPRAIRHQHRLERTVTLEVLEVFTGDLTGLSGIVTIEDGVPPPNVRSYLVVPAGFSDTDTEGVVFLSTEPFFDLGEVEDPELLRPRLMDARTLQLTLGENYRFATTRNFYRFAGSTATSDIDGRTLPISQLMAEIDDALGP